MKNLRVKRAFSFSLLLYIGTSVIFAVLSVLFAVDMDANPQDISLVQCVIYWILLIPLILLLSKWYFRKFQPSLKRGLLLGIVATVVSFLLDFIMIGITLSAGASIDMFIALYSNWKLYMTTILLIGVTTYAGFEFDRTYTFDETGLTKKSK